MQEFLDTAEQELRRVSIIANQTMRFQKQATRPTEVSASELFQNVLSLYEGRLKNSSITVEKFTRTQLKVACFYTTKGFNGTGLGLWISAEIIERHKGRISLRSSQAPSHHGTVFSLFLPFDAAVERL